MTPVRRWLLATVVLAAAGFGWAGGGWACAAWLSGVCFMDMVVPVLLRQSRYSLQHEENNPD